MRQCLTVYGAVLIVMNSAIFCASERLGLSPPLTSNFKGLYLGSMGLPAFQPHLSPKQPKTAPPSSTPYPAPRRTLRRRSIDRTPLKLRRLKTDNFSHYKHVPFVPEKATATSVHSCESLGCVYCVLSCVINWLTW